MKTALIVPTYNRRNILFRFIENVKSQTLKPDVFIVVDDGSSDGTSEMLTFSYPEIVHIKGKGAWWWTGSVNRGIEYILKNHDDVTEVVLQNDDTSFDNSWFENLVNTGRNNNNALIGCVAVSEDNPSIIAYAGRTKHPWFAVSRKFYIGRNLLDFDAEMLQPSFDLIGRGIYIPIDVFRKVGIYDEKHFKHRGDTELPLRARKAGYKLLISFKAVVKIKPLETSSIDVKKHYKLSDFKMKFFDFRSSAYWKYRFYYAKTLADSRLQHYVFFSFRMLWHFVGYLSRLRLF